MTAKDFFEQQLITDADSVIDKNAHKFSRTDLIKFATAYHESKVKNLDIPNVINQERPCETCIWCASAKMCKNCNDDWSNFERSLR